MLLRSFRKQLSIGLIIFFLLILHLFALSSYIQEQHKKNYVQKNNHLQHVFLELVIKASNTMPFDKLNTILSQISEYKLIIHNELVTISVEPYPKWHLQFKNEHSIDDINKLLTNSDHEVKISYQLKNGFWLNYAESILPNTYDIAMILSSVELAIIILIFFYSFSLRRFTLPLQSFKKTADNLGIDVNTKPIDIYGPKLVREAADAINKMQIRIQDLINSRTQMLAAISHDLRTPITRLKLLAHLIDNEQQAKKIINNLDEMEKMIEGVLTFSREDVTRERKTIFDINALLASICDDLADLDYKVHSKLLQYRLPFLGSHLGLKRAFNNLLQNAIKYADEVWVIMEQDGNNLIIQIKDNGPGIPENEFENVFKPYYRSERPSSAKSSTGTGLGLTIAREIIRAHQGSIDLGNNSEGGLLVTIHLPIQQSNT